MQNNFDSIPQELTVYKQWVVWKYEDKGGPKPTKRPYSPCRHEYAAVDDPETWGTFVDARLAYNSGRYDGLGFVLTGSDPYALIDLDDTNGDKMAFDRQLAIYNEFQSYTEWSPSGKGLHILVKGGIPAGRKRSNIEIYSGLRYMTVTGSVYRDLPLLDYHTQLNALYDQMTVHNGDSAAFALGMMPEQYSDFDICEQAHAAQNGQKFYDLYTGNFEQYYSSQSEADFALINIIAFYSKNAEQIQRIFKESALGQRKKADRTGYVSYMVNRAFDRMLPPIDIDGLRMQIEDALRNKPQTEVEQIQAAMPEYTAPKVAQVPTGKNPYQFPPGLVGDIARFIYDQSPRQVAEISLAGALGLMAGISGRAYNVSGTGLNMFVMLLAATGTGKESIASGIDKLIATVAKQTPNVKGFIGPGEIASPQALVKYLDKSSKSFVSIVGEFGIYLQQMAAYNAPPHLTGLRRLLLDLFTKSGNGRVLGKSVYSDKDKNTDDITAPAVTLMGESTPEKFYEGLHEGLISEGLLPRFTMIEYHGDRPPLNEAFDTVKPSFDLIERLSTLCQNAMMLNTQNKCIDLRFDEQSLKTFSNFDKFCDAKINNAGREVKRQLWNRSHLKAMKLAGLVAVGINPFVPVITEDVAQWAINLVVCDAYNLLAKIDNGEVPADNDETRQADIVSKTIAEFVKSDWATVESYVGDKFETLHSNKIVPYVYIQRKCTGMIIFRRDRLGPSSAIKRCIESLIDKGMIEEIDKPRLRKEFNTSGRAFIVTNLEILK